MFFPLVCGDRGEEQESKASSVYLAGGGKGGRSNAVVLPVGPGVGREARAGGMQLGSVALPTLARYCLLTEQCHPFRVYFRKKSQIKA